MHFLLFLFSKGCFIERVDSSRGFIEFLHSIIRCYMVRFREMFSHVDQLIRELIRLLNVVNVRKTYLSEQNV